MIYEFGGNKIECGRLVGGIAWPGVRQEPNRKVIVPGCIVLIAEELLPEKTYHRYHHMHILKEFSSQKKDELLETAVEWGVNENVQVWFGQKDGENDQYVHHWNRRMKSPALPKFKYYRAIHSDSGMISYHVEILMFCLRKDVKILHQVNETQAAQELQQLTGQALLETKAEEYPAIAALGYSVSYLRQHPPKERTYDDVVEKSNRGERYSTGY